MSKGSYSFSLNQPTGPIKSISLDLRHSPVCVFVCAVAEPLLPGELETKGFCCSKIFPFKMNFWVFGSSQRSLMCIMGELKGGGSVAVAVGVSKR